MTTLFPFAPKRIRLRIKFIILIVAMSLTPLLTVMVITVGKLQEIQKQNAISLDKQIAQSASEEVKAFVLEQFALIEHLGAIFPDIDQKDFNRDLVLERILYSNDNFTDITIVDVSGQETLRKNNVQVITKSDLVDRSQSPEFLGTKSFGYYLGPVEIIGGKPYFLIGKAIRSLDGTYQGAVFAQVDARVMQEVVKRISSVGDKGRAYIVNSKGIVIAHPDISQVLAQRDFSNFAPVKSFLDKSTPIDPAVSYENELKQNVLGIGLPVVFTFNRANQTDLKSDWIVVAEQQASIALATVRQITQFTLAVLVVVIVISLLSSMLFANRIVGPIELLHAASRQFGQGNLDFRVSVHTNDEIEDLASGFNEMASSILRSISLIESERNKTLAVINSLDDGVIVYDLEGRIIAINPRAQLFLSVKSEEIAGRKTDEIALLHEARFKKFELVSSLKLSDFEKKEVQLDATRLMYLNVVLLPLREGYKTIGSVKVLQDVTGQKELEQLKNHFVNVTAHQLRTPLGIIKWNLEMILDGFKGVIPTSLQNTLHKIDGTNKRMINLVNDMLMVSRIEEGYLAPKNSDLNACESVRILVKELQPEIEAKPVTVDIHAENATGCTVFVDPQHFRAVVQNLVSNAIKYSESGGKIIVKVEQIGAYLIVRVIDNGIGIPTVDQGKIFSKFYRAGNAVLSNADGSGLGLFLAKSYVENWGGRIWFVSSPSGGTTFYFTAPLKKATLSL